MPVVIEESYVAIVTPAKINAIINEPATLSSIVVPVFIAGLLLGLSLGCCYKINRSRLRSKVMRRLTSMRSNSTTNLPQQESVEMTVRHTEGGGV